MVPMMGSMMVLKREKLKVEKKPSTMEKTMASWTASMKDL